MINEKTSSFLHEPLQRSNRAWQTVAGAKRHTRHVLHALARLLLRAIYIYQRQLITIRRLHPVAPALNGAPDIECVVADTVSAIRALAHGFPTTFRDSIADMERLVASGHVVCFARRRSDDGVPIEVVGYEIAERGIFSALERRIRVDGDVIFSHWAEVLPAYRGRRIHGMLFATRDAYFRKRGSALVCGVCRPGNRASLRALRRDGARVTGVVKRVALSRLTLWRTPDAAIVQSIDSARRSHRDGLVLHPQESQE